MVLVGVELQLWHSALLASGSVLSLTIHGLCSRLQRDLQFHELGLALDWWGGKLDDVRRVGVSFLQKKSRPRRILLSALLASRSLLKV